MEEVRVKVFAEVERALREGPTDEQVATAVKSDSRAAETLLRKNGWWLNTLMDAYLQARYTGDVEETCLQTVAWQKETRSSLTREGVRDVLRGCLDTTRYTVVILRPWDRRRFALWALALLGATTSAAAAWALLASRRRGRLLKCI